MKTKIQTDVISEKEGYVMEKENLYEEPVFNDYAYAMSVKASAEERLQAVNSVWNLAIIGSICGVIGLPTGVLLLPAFVLACICYRKIGGFSVAARWSWNFAKFGWFVVPYFPIDLGIGVACFFVGLYSLFFLPFFVARHLKKQAEKDLEAAEEYVRFCK